MKSVQWQPKGLGHGLARKKNNKKRHMLLPEVVFFGKYIIFLVFKIKKKLHTVLLHNIALFEA